MADERLNKSEALFTFLHNIPVCLRPSVDVPKKRFFLATLFKGCVCALSHMRFPFGFDSEFRAVPEQFRSSSRAVPEQFSSNLGAI